MVRCRDCCNVGLWSGLRGYFRFLLGMDTLLATMGAFLKILRMRSV